VKINQIKAISFILSTAFSSLAISDSIPVNRLSTGFYGCYGFSGYHSYGVCADLINEWRIWNNKRTSGTIDVGFMAGYQREPFAQSNSILNGARAYGAAHRIEGLLTLGSTAYIPPSRRIFIGIDIFGGWAHVIMDGYFKNSRYNVSGDYRVDKGVFASGVGAHLGVRAAERISVLAKVLAPLPYAPAPVTSYGITITLNNKHSTKS
jgi:hypothetical protein